MQEQIQQYKILSKIGAGGMGEVYLAEDEMLDRKVALKILNPLLTADDQFRARFRQEAKLQAGLVHSGIVSLYTFFENAGSYVMVMEYAHGVMLKELIRNTGLIPEERALNILRQLLDGVGYAHAKGVIHRDIKPSNIIIDENDTVKIMDFGIAKLLGDKGMTKTGTKMGTLYYMSPEQVRAAKDIDGRTDIYSLGITLYEMLTGRIPFNAETDSDFEVMEEIVRGTMPDPRDVYPHISDSTVSLLNRMVEKDRHNRPATCDECFAGNGEMAAKKILVVPPIQSSRGILFEGDGKKAMPEKSSINDSQRDISGISWILVEGGECTFYKEKGMFFTKQIPYVVKMDSFFMSGTPVTFDQYDHYCEETGARKPDDNGWGRGTRPVINVNVAEAIAFCTWLSQKTGTTVRLPEENEWEYAARGGNKSKRYEYSGSNYIDEVTWYAENSGNKTREVAMKKPNELGIYDMSGNVWELCGPSGAVRGGSWFNHGNYCRVSSGIVTSPNIRFNHIGFRVLRNR